MNSFASSYAKDKGFRTVKSYKCLDTNVPELKSSAEEYSYFVASAWGSGSKKPRMAFFTWPVHQPAESSEPTEKSSSWCLRFSYSIVFTPELVVNMNGNLLWSSDGISTGEFREHVAINIPKPIGLVIKFLKYNLYYKIRFLMKITRASFININDAMERCDFSAIEYLGLNLKADAISIDSFQ